MNIRREIIQYSLAGVFIGATDFGIYYLLIKILSFSLSKGIAYICAGIVAYLFNKYWVFQCDRLSSYHEVSRYLIISFLALGINVLTNQCILNVWPGAILPALMIASIVSGSVTFVCFKWWVFRTPIVIES